MQTLEQIAPAEAPIEQIAPRRFDWNAELLYKLEGAGVFGDARIELIEGEVYEMSPIGPVHAQTTNKVHRTLESVLKGSD